MKNIRLLIGTLCLFGVTWFNSNYVAAQSSGTVSAPAGGTIELKIERLEMSPDVAATKIGQKVSLGIYVIFSKEWSSVMEQAAADVRFSESNISWAFYENESYSSTCTLQDPSHYLQSPADYIAICAVNGMSGQPSSGSCTVPNLFPDDWYATTMNWQQFGWPNFAWGSGFSGGIINVTKDYVEKKSDGSYQVKIYDIQFILKSAARDLPVGFLDDILGTQVVDASNSNCQINPVNALAARYWPDGQTGQDWTDLKGTKYCKMTPGGLFIERAPEVEKLERKLLA